MLLGQAQRMLEEMLSERELDAQQEDARVRPVRAGLEAVLALLRHHRALTRSHHELCNGARARSRANTLDVCDSTSPNACKARRALTARPLSNGQTVHEEGHASAGGEREAHNNEHSLSAGDLIEEEHLATRCDSDGNIRRVKVLINEDELEDFDGQVFLCAFRDALHCLVVCMFFVYEYTNMCIQMYAVSDAGAAA